MQFFEYLRGCVPYTAFGTNATVPDGEVVDFAN